jgi:hypothetical protein
MNTDPKDIEMILQSASQNMGFEPTGCAFIEETSTLARTYLPASTLYVLAFDSFDDARKVAKEARRISDQRRKLLTHVCTGQGEFRGLYVVTLI